MTSPHSTAGFQPANDGCPHDAGGPAARIRAILADVPDPEIPCVSVIDLGIVREIHGDRVVVTPTYTGCPATLAIERMIREALDANGFAQVAIETTLSPPWSTDWISDEGREKLRAYGIAPPPKGANAAALKNKTAAECPRCGSSNTEEISRFGSHAMQGALALQGVRGTVRPVQVPLMSIDFHKLRVVEVKRETPDAVSVRFELPEALREAFAFRAGQHLTFRRDFDGEEVRRNYSVCVSPSEGMLKIGVKKIAGGVFSGWVNDELKAGDVLDVMAPHGSFCWSFDPIARREYVAFAGELGITPVLSLMKTALAMEPRSRFTLFYGNRNSIGVMFLEEIAGLKDRYVDRLSVFHFLEEEEEEIELFNGRLDRAKAEDILSTLVKSEHVDAFFICGPGPMMDAIEGALVAKGVDKPRVLIERFTTGPLSAAQAAAARALEEKAAGLKMSVTLNGRRMQVAFDPEKHSILDNVRAAGLPAPFACKGGVCATCRAKVTAGEVSMKVNYGLSEQELAEGYVLTCQATPLTEGVALTYDA